MGEKWSALTRDMKKQSTDGTAPKRNDIVTYTDAYYLKRMLLFTERELLQPTSMHTMSTFSSSPCLSRDTDDGRYANDGYAINGSEPAALKEYSMLRATDFSSRKKQLYGRVSNSDFSLCKEGMVTLEEVRFHRLRSFARLYFPHYPFQT
jgi:hypothetical protein